MARNAAIAAVWSVVALYLGNRLGGLVGEAGGVRPLPSALLALPAAIAMDPLRVSGRPAALLMGTGLFAGVWVVYASASVQARSWMPGGEYGTARRGTVAEGQAYRDMEEPENNVVLTKPLGIAIGKFRMKGEQRVRTSREGLSNRNVIVVGGSGSNKTTGFVEPNLLQVGSRRDVVVTDPKGTCIGRCGMALVRAGVDIRWLNTVNPELSDVWSIFAGVRTRRQAVSWVEMFFSNTNNGRVSNDPVWDNGEKLFALSLILLMLDWMPRSDFTFRNFVRLKSMCEIAEEGDSKRSPLDLLFGQIETGLAPVPPEPDPGDGLRGAR